MGGKVTESARREERYDDPGGGEGGKGWGKDVNG